MEQRWVLNESEALELLAFLVTAARTQVDEAAEYGPMRLVMGAERLGELIRERVSAPTRDFMARSLEQLPALATPASDPESYAARLDSLCSGLAAHLASHFGRRLA